MKKTELAFAAALMEGEGTIGIRKPNGRSQGTLVVSCVNTDAQLISFLNDRWPGSCRTRKINNLNSRRAVQWQIVARQALTFIEAIEPHVVTNRMKERIETGRRYQRLKAKHWSKWTEDDFDEEACLAWYMRFLNMRGKHAQPVDLLTHRRSKRSRS